MIEQGSDQRPRLVLRWGASESKMRIERTAWIVTGDGRRMEFVAKAGDAVTHAMFRAVEGDIKAVLK